MLKKKQYYFSLLSGVVAFLLFFIGAYFLISLQMPTSQTGTAVTKNEQSTNTLVEVKEDVPRIEIYTKVILQTIDEGHNIVDRIPIAATTLLGVDESSIQKRFADCQVLKFSEREVILQKVMKQTENANAKDRYVLGLNDQNQICILDKKENNVITLQIKNSFSRQENSELLAGIPISGNQKAALIQSPNEIYKILQACEQE